MIVIDDKIISDDIIQREFVCNLSACKGACCVEGEGGAPLEEHELSILDDIYEDVKPFLTEEGIKVIEEQGKYVPFEAEYNDMSNQTGFETPLVEGGKCAYLNFDEKGIAKCQIERAWEEGIVNFQKPISCHLYPIRIKKYQNYDAVNYFKWDICSPACTLGKELQVPVYKFLKDPIVRKYGEDFYKQLCEIAETRKNEAENSKD